MGLWRLGVRGCGSKLAIEMSTKRLPTASLPFPAGIVVFQIREMKDGLAAAYRLVSNGGAVLELEEVQVDPFIGDDAPNNREYDTGNNRVGEDDPEKLRLGWGAFRGSRNDFALFVLRADVEGQDRK